MGPTQPLIQCGPRLTGGEDWGSYLKKKGGTQHLGSGEKADEENFNLSRNIV